MNHWLAIFICALIASDFVHGDEWKCPHSNVVVHSTDSDDADAACEAARKALEFLATQGLDTTGSVEVRLVTKLPMPCLQSGFGCYDQPNRRINMLVISECLKMRTWVELPLNRSLCESFLTHEVAHVVAAGNFTAPKPSTLAQEYVAYVTMVSTMSPRQRERLLEQLPGRGFDSADQMSTTYYQLDPARFSAEVYRHFIKLGNGKVFLQNVLSGRVLNNEGNP